MTLLVLAVFLAMLLVMASGWAFQRAVNNAGWSDVFWTFGTGISCAAAALIPSAQPAGPLWRHALVAVLVLLWSFRLGLYVALRVAKGTEDVRYANFRSTAGSSFQPKMLALLIVQAPVTALLAIAVIYAARQPDPHLRLTDGIGVIVIFAAIVGEALADRQMQHFKARHSGHDQVCDQGLWAISRHPNYLFEFLGWFAYPIIGISIRQPWSLLSLLAPALMFLVLRYLTGVPALEAAMRRRKGQAYAQYQARVGAIFPKPRLR